MSDLELGVIIGLAAALFVVGMVALVWRWQRGTSRDTLPDGVASTSEPDLSHALVEYQLFDGSKRVLEYAVPMAQLAATMDRNARWRMVAGDGFGSVELPIQPQLFIDIERLDIAVRAYEGAKLSDHDKAVLAGVLQPNRFGADSLPTLILNDAT